jgi:hypothetical protein
MAKVTYGNFSPEDIRSGDIVGERERDGWFVAHSDAVLDQWQEWNVLDDKGRYRSFGLQQRVTITVDESEDTYA